MKQYIKKVAVIMAITIGLVSLAGITPTVNAAGTGTNVFKGCAGDNKTICDGNNKLEDQFKTIINVLLFIIGMVAVVMIIIGGIRYTTSNGDSGNIKSAKDTILYAVVGLIVAILAFAIVNFVVTAFK